MPDVTSSSESPSVTAAPVPLRQHLTRMALIVAVLGVLPFALDAPPAWQVLGTLVAAAMAARSMQLIWRAVFSTDPRHLRPLA